MATAGSEGWGTARAVDNLPRAIMPQQILQQSLAQRAPPLQQQRLLPGRAPRHKAVACYARRTVSGSSDTSTNKGSPVKRPDSSSKTRGSKTTQVTVKPPTPAPQHNSSRGLQQRQPNKRSALEEFMRTTPGGYAVQCRAAAVLHSSMWHALRLPAMLQ